MTVSAHERLDRAQRKCVLDGKSRYGKIADRDGRYRFENCRLKRLWNEHGRHSKTRRITNSRRLNFRLRQVGLHLPGHLRRKAFALGFLAQREVAHTRCQAFTEHHKRGLIELAATYSISRSFRKWSGRRRGPAASRCS